MFEVDDFVMAGSLLLGAGYVWAAVRGGGGEEGEYRRGLRHLVLGIFFALVLPEVTSVVLGARGAIGVQVLVGTVSFLAGTVLLLKSVQALCLFLRGRGE